VDTFKKSSEYWVEKFIREDKESCNPLKKMSVKPYVKMKKIVSIE
jgi:hypothetical protein